MSSSNNSGGAGLCSLLTVLFIGLKLGHVIDWSWWWVLSPLWITFLFVIVVSIGVVVWAWWDR